MEAALTIVSVLIGLYAGWRMLGRSARAVWAATAEWVTSSGWVRQDDVPAAPERRSQATERLGNAPEPPLGNTFPPPVPAPLSLVGRMEAMPHERLVGAMALFKNEDGTWRYAESRLAKFAGGRVEDRIAEIRAIRGETPPPARVIPHRVNGEERRLVLD